MLARMCIGLEGEVCKRRLRGGEVAAKIFL